MANTEYLSYKTRGNANPKDKARVYFCCHPEDFDRYFEKVCDDLLKAQDCAIYYTPNMEEPLPEEYRDVDLERMKLFVVPVTFRLMSQPNRAMDSDIAFAKEHNIAILPLMMETGIDEFYAKEENFGKRQYLNPYLSDATAVSYEEKLNKYLQSILISNETAQRIRKAFDAYIFLSYRKKDRNYANELMKLIHDNPRYQDIAIWYDEFITPGEDFSEDIRKAMENSKLFALLVTPNLVNEDNYVSAIEYPEAYDKGMPILPAEMQKTDRKELEEKFKNIPACTDPYNDEEFKERFAESLKQVAISENDADPEHNYLIGLAYLDGIDVEINVDRGVKLLTMAAEAGFDDAMEKLADLYKNGDRVDFDRNKAFYWAEKIFYKKKATLGYKNVITINALLNLAEANGSLGKIDIQLEQYEKVYSLRCEVLGETHCDTMAILNALIEVYEVLGVYVKKAEAEEKMYLWQCETFGSKHLETVVTLGDLAVTYGKAGNYAKAIELNEQTYVLQCELLGEKHPDTWRTLFNLASAYGEMGNYQTKLELVEKIYVQKANELGEKDPNTLRTMYELATAYEESDELAKALDILEKLLPLQLEVNGNEHFLTPEILMELSQIYMAEGNEEKADEYQGRLYQLEENADTKLPSPGELFNF